MHIKSKRHNLDEVSKKCLLLNILSSPVETLYINAEQQFMADQLLCTLNTRRGETNSARAAVRVFPMEDWWREIFLYIFVYYSNKVSKRQIIYLAYRMALIT